MLVCLSTIHYYTFSVVTCFNQTILRFSLVTSDIECIELIVLHFHLLYYIQCSSVECTELFCLLYFTSHCSLVTCDVAVTRTDLCTMTSGVRATRAAAQCQQAIGVFTWRQVITANAPHAASPQRHLASCRSACLC